jgi:hypothetical protein
MSGDEKAMQVGQAVQAYQAAKIECAHIERKIDRVGAAYRVIGGFIGLQTPEAHQPRMAGEKLHLHSSASDDDFFRFLLNEHELTELFAERDRLRSARDLARKAMNQLGIVGID